MENILLEFVDILDQSLKKFQREAGDGSGFARLTIHQLNYMDVINSLGEPTITEIAEKLRISKASVTIGINKLIRLGYVKKQQSTIDRRVFHIRLTEPAQGLIRASFQALHDYGEFVRAALSEEEVQQFQVILAKIIQLCKNQSPSQRHS
jgi:DNA-binding MarR family transcriptional regulator